MESNTLRIDPPIPAHLPQWLWDYAQTAIVRHNIDESHGLWHLVNTVLYTRIIMAEFADRPIIDGLSKQQEYDILSQAAFVHDLIDAKYVDEQAALADLRIAFAGAEYPPAHFAIIAHIITSMSFSKRIARRKDGLPMIEPGPLHLAVAIVVDADQLDGYDAERCRIYQETKYFGPNADTRRPLDERSRLCRGWRRTILERRVLHYRDEYMNTEIARELAEPLHQKVVRHVVSELADAELYAYP